MSRMTIRKDGSIEIVSDGVLEDFFSLPSDSYIDVIQTLNNIREIVLNRESGEQYTELFTFGSVAFTNFTQMLGLFSRWYPVDNSGKNIDLWKSYFAYILATIKHETAHSWEPCYEAFYLNNGSPPDGGVGSPEWLSELRSKAGRYEGGVYPAGHPWAGVPIYFGRGFVQLTHDYNYEKFDIVLKKPRFGTLFSGIDLLNIPEQALDKVVSMAVTSYGMLTEGFRGEPPYTLSKYMGGNIEVPDFFNARDIVNADKNRVYRGYSKSVGATIADYATDFYNAIVIKHR